MFGNVAQWVMGRVQILVFWDRFSWFPALPINRSIERLIDTEGTPREGKMQNNIFVVMP